MGIRRLNFLLFLFLLVFEYIVAFYNTVRIHGHCNYMSSEQFEKLFSHLAARGITVCLWQH